MVHDTNKTNKNRFNYVAIKFAEVSSKRTTVRKMKLLGGTKLKEPNLQLCRNQEHT